MSQVSNNSVHVGAVLASEHISRKKVRIFSAWFNIDAKDSIPKYPMRCSSCKGQFGIKRNMTILTNSTERSDVGLVQGDGVVTCRPPSLEHAAAAATAAADDDDQYPSLPPSPPPVGLLSVEDYDSPPPPGGSGSYDEAAASDVEFGGYIKLEDVEDAINREANEVVREILLDALEIAKQELMTKQTIALGFNFLRLIILYLGDELEKNSKEPLGAESNDLADQGAGVEEVLGTESLAVRTTDPDSKNLLAPETGTEASNVENLTANDVITICPDYDTDPEKIEFFLGQIEKINDIDGNRLYYVTSRCGLVRADILASKPKSQDVLISLKNLLDFYTGKNLEQKIEFIMKRNNNLLFPMLQKQRDINVFNSETATVKPEVPDLKPTIFNRFKMKPPPPIDKKEDPLRQLQEESSKLNREWQRMVDQSYTAALMLTNINKSMEYCGPERELGSWKNVECYDCR